MSRRSSELVALLVAAGLVIAACGDDDDSFLFGAILAAGVATVLGRLIGPPALRVRGPRRRPARARVELSGRAGPCVVMRGQR
jgi:hypothetical protein